MTNQKTRFGLTLPNRGVIIGATTVDEMFTMAQWAEDAGWDSVWVGDSILAKPRLDALVLLGALAARTKRVKLGSRLLCQHAVASTLAAGLSMEQPGLHVEWANHLCGMSGCKRARWRQL